MQAYEHKLEVSAGKYYCYIVEDRMKVFLWIHRYIAYCKPETIERRSKTNAAYGACQVNHILEGLRFKNNTKRIQMY